MQGDGTRLQGQHQDHHRHDHGAQARSAPSGGTGPRVAAFFDLDNTLVPFMRAFNAWADAWAKTVVSGAHAGSVADELLGHMLSAGEDPHGAVRRTASKWGFDGPAVEDANGQARLAYQRAIRAYPGVHEMLRDLQRQGLALAIVTDAPRARAEERLAHAGLADAFDVVVTRDDSPRGKHGPEPFRLALSRLGLAPGEVAMVGDWPRFDARWPNRLGMRTVLAGWGVTERTRPRARGERPWAVAEHPGEVPRFVCAPADAPSPRPFRPDGTASLFSFGARAPG